MSYSFTVHGSGVPELTLRAVLDAQPYRDLASVPPGDGPDAAARLPALVRLFRPGLSTRAVELSRNGDEASVRILVCSSPADHEVALAIAAAVAGLVGVDVVEPEGELPMPVDDLIIWFGKAWYEMELAFGASAVARVVEEVPGRVADLAGPIRNFAVGARLLGELRDGDPDTYPDRLVAAMQRAQWPGEGRVASVFGVSAGDHETRIAVLTGSTRTILPDIDGVAVRDGPDQIYVPPDVLVQHLPGVAASLDERQVIVEPVDPAV